MKYSPKRLKDARIQKRMTAIELAREAGVSRTTISLIENGKAGNWVKAMRKIERVLGVIGNGR